MFYVNLAKTVKTYYLLKFWVTKKCYPVVFVRHCVYTLCYFMTIVWLCYGMKTVVSFLLLLFERTWLKSNIFFSIFNVKRCYGLTKKIVLTYVVKLTGRAKSCYSCVLGSSFDRMASVGQKITNIFFRSFLLLFDMSTRMPAER